MNLQQLVQLRNSLSSSIDLSIIKREIESNLDRLEFLQRTEESDVKIELTNLINQHKQSLGYLSSDLEYLNKVINIVQDKINHLSIKFFSDNYQVELFYHNIDAIRKVRVMAKNDEFETMLFQRISHHSSWKFPALELGCRDGEWTKHLVANDPLYISDYFPEFIESSIQQFPSLYQNRVRKYIINDYFKINNLPLNQFGFIFSYNFFNYLSLDSIKQLMIQSFNWLRPGGTVLFTYNNADLPIPAAYAESYFMTYVPKSILVPMIESIGFIKSFSADINPSFSIVEFTKPGILTTNKAGQVLGEIKSKN
jgi:hypothetical protein